MLAPIFAGLTSFILAFIFLPFFIRFSKQRNLLAVPGKRSIHKQVTPSLGGVAIFFSFTVACLSWRADPQTVIFQLLLILIIPFIVGLLDDMIPLKPMAKLTAQGLTASLLFFTIDIRLDASYGLFGDHHFPLGISYAATLFIMVLITNSFNLIDGIDGLAATFSLMATLFFGVWFIFVEAFGYATICFALCGGILAFLFQNWEPSRIFMGDTGSLFIGTLLSILMIQFIKTNYHLPPENNMKFSSSIGTAITVMIIPLIDTIRIIIIRLSKRLSPFSPDKRHIHHALVRLNLSHRQAVCILALAHVVFVGLALLMRNLSDWHVLGATILLATLLSLILSKVLKNYLTYQKTSSA